GPITKGKWVPTPPNYMDPIEPHWGDLRPFTFKDGAQFAPEPPTEFNMTEGSKFHREAREVYEIVNSLTKEERKIAAFWDCNPYVVLHKGHFMQPIKKITPGGHWMGITRIVCQKSDLSFAESLKTYTYVAVALADAFISCWDEKYRSSYIRPETVINTFWDDKWLPTLQTPPFPEYTSGHSVISTAAARALTHLMGDDYSFVDEVEVEYGLGKRAFPSFLAASEEAAISRVYGGIHFRPAVEVGVNQGHEVADQVLQTLSKYE
ncbi:MAG: phosphatase PAP2 family protein, partial [Bacteroidetes bacterium]|nr:phosphatase PAP2 family protein [Bacteroidota bacterium]